jgi:hypothetical protein
LCQDPSPDPPPQHSASDEDEDKDNGEHAEGGADQDVVDKGGGEEEEDEEGGDLLSKLAAAANGGGLEDDDVDEEAAAKVSKSLRMSSEHVCAHMILIARWFVQHSTTQHPDQHPLACRLRPRREDRGQDAAGMGHQALRQGSE